MTLLIKTLTRKNTYKLGAAEYIHQIEGKRVVTVMTSIVDNSNVCSNTEILVTYKVIT